MSKEFSLRFVGMNESEIFHQEDADSIASYELRCDDCGARKGANHKKSCKYYKNSIALLKGQ